VNDGNGPIGISFFIFFLSSLYCCRWVVRVGVGDGDGVGVGFGVVLLLLLSLLLVVVCVLLSVL